MILFFQLVNYERHTRERYTFGSYCPKCVSIMSNTRPIIGCVYCGNMYCGWHSSFKPTRLDAVIRSEVCPWKP